jgi:DHA1 family bicyclomycin/chloramphenicol resistance-like MFS transporter
VSTLFLGLAARQLFYGPLSDSVGRKPAIVLGYAVFGVGPAHECCRLKGGSRRPE